MSYISFIQPETSVGTQLLSRTVRPSQASQHAYEPASPAGRLSTGLELTLLVATLSGLSLVLSTIAAGAF